MKTRSIIALFSLLAVLVGCSTSSDDGLEITSVSITAGNSGEEVVVTGKNFGTTVADVTVRFGPAAAEVVSVTDTEITTAVPALAPIGATTIQVVIGDETATIDFTVNDPLVGNWLSEGTNIAPLLAGAPFNTVRITAEFRADNTYTVVTTDANDAEVTLTGTWSTGDGSGTIRTVTVNQSSPTTLTSEGIYQNVDGLLTYEVAQTNPPLTGVTAPTAAAGFGSTSGGNFGVLNIQKYVRAN